MNIDVSSVTYTLTGMGPSGMETRSIAKFDGHVLGNIASGANFLRTVEKE